nr:hypothetical protein BaRGS_013415 [Batillaria attramentaria]
MIQLIVNDNVPKEKIDLGIPLFGHTLTLTDPTNTDLGAPIANSQETVNYYEVEYVMENGLGGVSVFSIDMDDFNGLCGEKNPLLNTIHNSLNGLVESKSYRTVCYIQGWTHWREDPVKFEPEDVDTSLCTHVVWSSAELDETGTNVTVHDNGDEQLYQRLTALKQDQPELKVMLEIGGWGMGSEEFT